MSSRGESAGAGGGDKASRPGSLRSGQIALIAVALALGLIVALPDWVGPRAAPGTDEACSAPNSVIELGAPLVHTALRLRRQLPVKIVAIGSSSTWGTGASDRAHAYPGQLAVELADRNPAWQAVVINQGVPGQETPQMLARFDRDVLAQRPDLVIWQVGSNEILRNHDPAAFQRQVEQGVARLRAAGVDVILMNAQYTPRILRNPRYPTFNQALEGIARRTRVALLDRFDAMRYWLTSGHMGWSQLTGKDQVHMTDAGYHCIAALLARLIDADLPTVASR